MKSISSPMISKACYSSLKYSPYSSPFAIKGLGMHSMNHMTGKESEGQSKVLNNSLFSLSLLSPTQEKEMTSIP